MSRRAFLPLAGLVALSAVSAFVLLSSIPLSVRTAHPVASVSSTPATAAPATTPLATAQLLSLGAAAFPKAICAMSATTCGAGVGVTRVTLSAQAGTSTTATWPDVQVAFVIETTAYDGVYNHYLGYPGYDKCAQGGGTRTPCEESNGVPFMMDHASAVASAIAQANPHSQVSFAMVDFFGTDCGDWNDCGDSVKYHVDIPQFVGAAGFGQAVTASLKDQVFGGTYSGIVGLDDNFLHSPSITALFGALIGSGLDWSPNTHHVVVLMGSTAPRDPNYVENYYVSPFDSCCGGSQADGWTCEPGVSFVAGTMPNCEGWVRSQDGNPKDSIAQLAHNSPTCVDSIGGVCTIDTVDYWTTPTDPYSPGWPVGSNFRGGGPGGPIVLSNTAHVIEAGCDLAAATGGSWAGPAFASCADGQAGTLQYVNHGSIDTPNTDNPTLLAALRQISFGPVYSSLVANGTSKPMFEYVPFGAIVPSNDPQWAASCATPTGFLRGCQQAPTVQHLYGVTLWGWNWSTTPADNSLYIGDSWTVSFNAVATGPPYQLVPVDACVTLTCRVAGSGSLAGQYTEANYRLPTNLTVVQSFPVATVNVEIAISATAPPTPVPSAPPAPPGVLVPTAPVLPVLSPVGTLNTLGISNVSLQATAAGFLGAGFMRVSLKNRPIAMKVAAMSGKVTSKFEKAKASESSSGIGTFE